MVLPKVIKWAAGINYPGISWQEAVDDRFTRSASVGSAGIAVPVQLGITDFGVCSIAVKVVISPSVEYLGPPMRAIGSRSAVSILPSA